MIKGTALVHMVIQADKFSFEVATAQFWTKQLTRVLLQASPTHSTIANITLLRTPKPRRLIAPSLRSGSGGLNLMLFLFNTPRDAVTITASPAAGGHQSLATAADMHKPKQSSVQLALLLTLVRLAVMLHMDRAACKTVQ